MDLLLLSHQVNVVCTHSFFVMGYCSYFFSDSSVGKESACNAWDPSSIPGSGRSTGEGIGYPLQSSWASPVAQLVKNLPAMQETWVWSLVGKFSWRRERLPTPVFLPGELHGLYSPWGHKEMDTTEWLSLSLHFAISHLYVFKFLCTVHNLFFFLLFHLSFLQFWIHDVLPLIFSLFTSFSNTFCWNKYFTSDNIL